jgi:hypothetical protein
MNALRGQVSLSSGCQVERLGFIRILINQGECVCVLVCVVWYENNRVMTGMGENDLIFCSFGKKMALLHNSLQAA